VATLCNLISSEQLAHATPKNLYVQAVVHMMMTTHFCELPTKLFDNLVDSMERAQKTPIMGESFATSCDVVLCPLLVLIEVSID
jgi:hypothetical protein